MEKVLGEKLLEKKLCIAAAESCTGGLLVNKLTDVPGSSGYVKGAMVAYSNEVKQRHLEVSDQMLKEYGAVSKPVALRMARAIAYGYGADIGISTTGIAGPSGGTKAKPVGTVWIGYYSKDEHFAVKTVFSKDRLTNKQKSVAVAMDLIRRRIEGIETYPYKLQPEFA
jgi:nicotinamide-nucleotide amidase